MGELVRTDLCQGGRRPHHEIPNGFSGPTSYAEQLRFDDPIGHRATREFQREPVIVWSWMPREECKATQLLIGQ
jgi:hypothetical protein